MPTEAELSADHQLSRQTVRRALQELVAEGLVYRVRGRGTFATTIAPGGRYLRSFGSIEDLLALSVDTTMETLAPLERRADIDAASRLQLASDEVMTVLVRRAHGAAPFSVTRLSFSVELGSRLAAAGAFVTTGETTATTGIGVLESVVSARVAGAHQSITAATAPPDLAPLIDAVPGAAVLRIDRLYYDEVGHPVQLAVGYYNPERYTYRVELSRRLER